MKKYLIIVLLIAGISLLILQNVKTNKETEPVNNELVDHFQVHDETKDGEIVRSYEGVVTHIGESYILTRFLNEPPSSISSLQLNISDDTEIFVHGRNASWEDLAIGDQVQVTFYGGIAESLPGLVSHVVKIEVE